MLRSLVLAGLLLVSALSMAQSSVEAAMAKKSDEVLMQMRKVQILNQILPLVLEKEQIKAMLPTVEKIRSKIKEIHKTEYNQLLTLDNPTKLALKEAMEGGKMPSKEVLQKIGEFYGTAQLVRDQYVQDNVNQLYEVMSKTLNKGQLKAAANSLTLQFYEPNVQPDKVNDEYKIRVFIREVMLDPVTYDLLIQMSK